jgi:hypothetical protein
MNSDNFIKSPELHQTNLVLIDCRIQQYKIFEESCNEQTFPLIYHPNNLSNLSNLSKNKFKRIGIVAHGSKDPTQFDQVQIINWLKSLFDSTISDPRIDFLGCGLLLEPAWNDYWVKLKESIPGLIVGASSDATGNIKSHGNWAMESTNESVSSIYWTTQIENYLSLLTNQDIVTINRIQYQIINSAYAEVCGYDQDLEPNQIIPPFITIDSQQYPVKTIGSSAFFLCTTLETIILPDQLINIGPEAFSHCGKLITIKLPSKITVIANNVFCKCFNLHTVHLPKDLINIESRAFYKCVKLQLISIPDNVTGVGSYCFGKCLELQQIVLPNSIESIGLNAFIDCYKLIKIIWRNNSMNNPLSILNFNILGGLNEQLTIYLNNIHSGTTKHMGYSVKKPNVLHVETSTIPLEIYKLYPVKTKQPNKKSDKLITLIKNYIEPYGPFINPIIHTPYTLGILSKLLSYRTLEWTPASSDSFNLQSDNNNYTLETNMDGFILIELSDATNNYTLELSHSFTYYSHIYSSLHIGKNGYIGFGNSSFNNLQLNDYDMYLFDIYRENPVILGGVICNNIFHDVINFTIYYKYLSNDILIIKWNITSDINQMQFQIKLWLDNSITPGKIEISYDRVIIYGMMIVGLLDGHKSHYDETTPSKYMIIPSRFFN